MPKGASAKGAVVQTPGVKVAKGFLAALVENGEYQEFLCTGMCASALDNLKLMAPGSYPVDELMAALKKLILEVSFDNLDAVVNIDNRTEPLPKLMGCSMGRLIIENARDELSKRCAEHTVDSSMALVWTMVEKLNEASLNGSVKQAVVILREMDKAWDEIQAKTSSVTKAQAGKLKELEARMRQLQLQCATIPVLILRPLMDACNGPYIFSASLEKVITALEDVDKFDGSSFQTYVEEKIAKIDGQEKELAAKKRKSSDGVHWKAVQKKFEDANVYRSAAHDITAWGSLYKFDDKAILTAEKREAWEKLGRTGGRCWDEAKMAGWASFAGKVLHPFALWVERVSKSRFEEVAESLSVLVAQV